METDKQTDRQTDLGEIQFIQSCERSDSLCITCQWMSGGGRGKRVHTDLKVQKLERHTPVNRRSNQKT